MSTKEQPKFGSGRFVGRKRKCGKRQTAHAPWNSTNGRWVQTPSGVSNRTLWVCRLRCRGTTWLHGRRAPRGRYLVYVSRIYEDAFLCSVTELGAYRTGPIRCEEEQRILDHDEVDAMWTRLERRGFPKRPDGWDTV